MSIPGFFDASDFDILRVIQSQYAGSPRLKSLTVTCWSLLNPESSIGLMYEHMIDPWTADGAGLDVWGRIVATARRIYAAGESVILDDYTYRKYIFVKALFNLTNSSLHSINFFCGQLISLDGSRNRDRRSAGAAGLSQSTLESYRGRRKNLLCARTGFWF